MSGPSRSGRLFRRAVPALLVAVGMMAGLLALGALPAVEGLFERLGGTPTLLWQVSMAAAIGLLAGGLVLLVGLAGPDRAVGQALALVDSTGRDSGATSRRETGEARMEELPQALAAWSRRADDVVATQRRLETGARELAALLRTAQPDGSGSKSETGRDGPVGGQLRRVAADDSESETLRELAGTAAALLESIERRHQVIDALLARVEDDLGAVQDPLRPAVAEMEDALRQLDELIRAWPALTPLVSLRNTLGVCLAEMHRSRRAAALVDRELSAVRRRVGGARVIRLTTEDFVGSGEDPGSSEQEPP